MASKSRRLNPKQELFCQLFVRDSRFSGNATQAYLEAYGLHQSQYESALRSSSRLMINVDIRRRINELLDEYLKQEVVDRELAFIILQRKDLPSKVAAIREYNRLRNRVSGALEGTFVFRWEDEKE